MTDPNLDTFQLSKKTASTQSGKPKTTILRRKTHSITVLFNGKNHTPKELNPDIYRHCRERQLGSHDDHSLSGIDTASYTALGYESTHQAKSTFRFRTEAGQNASTFQGSIFHGSMEHLATSMPSYLAEDARPVDRYESELIFGTSSFDTLSGYKPQKAPNRVSLILSETETFIILDIPSCIAIKDTEEGDLVEEENRNYEYLTEGKGRNRKVANAESQTVQILRKNRNTESEEIKTKKDHAFASLWDMYDTYNEQEQNTEPSDSDSSDEVEFQKFQERSSIDCFRMSSDEKQMHRLLKFSRFQEALCVIERLLANNCYNKEQKIFRGLSEPDSFRADINYKYSLNLLWTFSNNATKGRCVTALEWNPSNKDLVAVGYGKFYFSETSTGMVMIWNIKNPVQPERVFNFEDPVTTLSFSKKDPNLLALGTYTGRVIVINITSRDTLIIAQNIPSFEAVWHVIWRTNPDTTKDREQICTSNDDGRVIFYTIEGTKELQATHMMRVAKADGKLKGFQRMRVCTNLTVPVSRYAGARFMKWHPCDPSVYLVGTIEGVIHKCSTNYLNQHLDFFFAHGGPVNDLQYSPFSNKIFATCGDDWILRIWAEGIPEPLHEIFVTMMAIDGMDWSPVHSTILATIYGKTILLWDFQRKVWKPQSKTLSPTGSRNTVVQFTDSGKCLVVGDVDGNVHVFSLTDMPFPSFFQENSLLDAIEKSLNTNLGLMEKVKKLRKKGQKEKKF